MMTCEGARAAIAAGREDDATLAHLETCTGCLQALDAGVTLAAPPAPAPAPEVLQARVSDAIARERGPIAWLRARSAAVRLLLALALLAAWIAQADLAAVHRDLDAYPRGRLFAIVLGLLATGGLAAAISLRSLARRALSPALERMIVVVAVLLPLGPALLPEVHVPGPFAGRGAAGDLAPFSLHCFAIGVGISISFVVLLRLLDRTAHAGSARAMIAAGAAALLGSLVLFVRCPIDAPLHLLLGHALIGVALVVGYRLTPR